MKQKNEILTVQFNEPPELKAADNLLYCRLNLDNSGQLAQFLQREIIAEHLRPWLFQGWGTVSKFWLHYRGSCSIEEFLRLWQGQIPRGSLLHQRLNQLQEALICRFDRSGTLLERRSLKAAKSFSCRAVTRRGHVYFVHEDKYLD